MLFLTLNDVLIVFQPDEVRDRLRQLGMNIPIGAKPQLCNWCNETSYNLPEHKEQCNNKHVKCYACKEEYPTQFIRAHFKNCDKRKGKKKNDGKKKDNKKNKKDGADDDDDDEEDGKKKRKGKTNIFTFNVHGAKKYKILKRLITPNDKKGRKKGKRFAVKPWIKQLVLGNEFGSGPRPHGHTHGVITTQEKMTYEEFETHWKRETKIKLADFTRSKNFVKDVRYCTKEDYRPILCNVDWDNTSVLCRAYIAARKYPTLESFDYPYCYLATWVRINFKEFFLKFREMEEADNLRALSNKVVLRPWQERFVRFLDWHDSPREIIWVVDQVGNSGKTFLSFYLQDQMGALRVPNVSSNDFAYAYNYQRLVIFDYERDSKDHINYRILENLKNGSLWSPKYESRSKNFRGINVKVVCFANYPPDYERLSADRWVVFNLENGRIKRVKIPDQLTLHLPTEEDSIMPPVPELPAAHQAEEEPAEEVVVAADPPPPSSPLRAFPVGRYVDSRFIVIEHHQ